MDRPDARLYSRSRSELVQLVASVWEEIGWIAEVSDEPDDGADIVARQPAQGKTNIQIINVVPVDRLATAEDVNEAADILRTSGADSGVVVSLHGFTDEAKSAFKDVYRLYDFDGAGIFSLMKNFDAVDLLTTFE